MHPLSPPRFHSPTLEGLIQVVLGGDAVSGTKLPGFKPRGQG